MRAPSIIASSFARENDFDTAAAAPTPHFIQLIWSDSNNYRVLRMNETPPIDVRLYGTAKRPVESASRVRQALEWALVRQAEGLGGLEVDH
jgi:hypothetical protein